MSTSYLFRTQRATALILLCAALALVLTVPALGRDYVPTPPGGGEGVNVLPADQENPLDIPAPGPAAPRRDWLPRDDSHGEQKSGQRYDDIGGDDVEVVTVVAGYDDDLAVAANGDLFSIVWYDYDDSTYRFVVRRSDDGGTTWRDWADFYDPRPGYYYRQPTIHVAEGAEDRVFVAYSFNPDGGYASEIHVAWSPLNLENGDFSNDTLIHTTYWAHSPSLTSDAATFDEYFVYLTFSADEGNGDDIHFVRSVDQGTTWEASYEIGSIGVNDRGYYHPQVAVGYGGWVHVVWYLGFENDHEYDNSLRYRRASNYAGGGLGSWGNMQVLTSHLDDINEQECQIAASWTSEDVMIAAMRRFHGEFDHDGIGTLSSGDAGDSWSGVTVVGADYYEIGDLLYQETNHRWILGVDDFGWGFHWAPVATPSSWSALQVFADGFYSSGEPALILDPSHDYRIGIVGGRGNFEADTYSFLFDAEWRADPGFPNMEPGFPVELGAAPISPPALVDVDGDGDLEIVYSDELQQIQVINHDGSSPPGWPVDVGADLSDGPVAVGDLDGDGVPILAVGGTDGKAYAYDRDGQLLPGWPSAIAPDGYVCYVSIGAVGHPGQRTIVAAAGNYFTYRSIAGTAPPGAIGWTVGGGGVHESPMAIGDVDDDGVAEVVGAVGNRLVVAEMQTSPLEVLVTLPAAASDAVTLGDLDFDGDLEILFPSVAGNLYGLDHTGVSLGGNFPFVTGSAVDLTSAAIAQCRGSLHPDIAFARRTWTVYLLYDDGAQVPGYPATTGVGWHIWGSPIIDHVRGSMSNVVIGSRDQHCWSWTNAGFVNPGWPVPTDGYVDWSPAMGDIDQDGSLEVVVLSTTQLLVIDINQTVFLPGYSWPMYGHDPQRTGCADCPEDLVTPVDPGADGPQVTRVRFAPPSPNPVCGATTFEFAVPLRAAVSLDVFDIRGRRVYTVYREETEPGVKTVTWHGRGESGESLASGHYLARLRVRGPGVDELLTRKLTILR